MRKIYQLLVAAICLSASITSYSQNNLAPGDLAIVSYQSDADPTNTFNPALLEFDDRFSIVVLKPGGLTAGTVIYFTDRGWDGPNNIWLDESYPPFTFGIGSEAVIKWVVPVGGIVQGKEVFFINKYHDELPPGSEYYQWFAYSDEPGTIPLGTITNETPIVPTALPQPNGYTDGMSLFNAGDNILVYQTGPPAGAPTNYNDATRRFITAILANIRPTNVGTPTSYAAWDVAPNVQNESSIPPGLLNGQTCFLMSPGPLPHPTSPVPGTVEPDNGKFSNCALSVAGTCTALQMSTLIYTTANWTYLNTVFPAGTSSSLCTYNILGTNTATLSSGAGTNIQSVSIGTPITNITYNTTGATGATFTGLPLGVTGNWAANVVTISGTPTSAVGSPFNYTVILTGGCPGTNPTGTITVTCPTITVTNPVVTTGTINSPFSQTFTATNGTGPYLFTTLSPLPAGITLSTAGVLSGTPTVSGTFNIVVTATDVNLCAGNGVNYPLVINTCGATAIATPSSQTSCSGTAITSIVFTGTGTTFNWTRDNTVAVTGIAASGSGNISGTLTNTTAAPITVTFTIIPNDGSCNGTPITATVIVSPTPTTATAGSDLTACISPGTATMAANTPAVGTGAWTQTAGPVSTIIFTPGSPTTNIAGLTTAGTYTFRWTITSGSCPASFDEMTITVNPNPAPFTLAGGGTFCPGTTTLTGPVDPNYTYTWERSLTGIATPNSFTAFGGTASTQAITVSGNYRLRVTNQFGCSASDTTPVSMADYVFNGSLATGDAQQTGRLNRFAVVSTCAAPKTCPGIFTTTGARFYDSYTITNPRNVPVCATIGLTSNCGTSLFNVVYTGSFNPTSLCTNYLADPGSSFPGTGFMEATIPANGTIFVVVHEVNPGAGCTSYQLTVDLPRDLSPITATPPTVPCGGGTSLLTAAPYAGSYLWSPGGATTQSITTPTLFADTEFFATMGYGNNGCTRLDSVTVLVSGNAPTITCPGNISLSNTTGQCSRVVTYTTTVGGTPAPTVTYAFTGATTASGSGDGSGSTFNVGVTNVTVTVTNSCGSSSCSFTVTINDTQPPTVTIGTIASCYSTVAAAQAAALAATSATDNCPGVLTETASTVGTCSAVVTVTTTDVAGNSTAVTYNTRIDNTPPVLTCPAPLTVSCTSAVPTANISDVTGVSDNCTGPVTVTHQGDVVSGQTCSNRFTITRTYRATDGCGNFAECTQIITVNDQTAPTLTCPAPLTVSCASAVPAPNIALVTGVSDNCGGTVIVTHQGDVISGQTCSNRFTITRTYRATDVCGNFAECTQIITVNDQTPPSLTCPAPVTVSCASAVPAPNVALVTGVSDNCGGTVTVTHQGDVVSGQTCSNRFTITRTYRATDVCGNFAECTQIITVNDQTPPTLTCPAPVTVSCASAVPAPNVALVTGVSDNCGGTVTVTHQGDVISGQTCSNRFTITRTYRATDVCGNFAECTQIITVNDQTPPVLTCPAPVTVSCASAVPAPNIALVTGVSDNCGGTVTVTFVSDVVSNQTCANRFTITRTYRATDVCGNFAQCTQIITVNDQTPPVVTCPAAVTVSCASAVPVPNTTLVTATDNCAGVITITHIGDVISNQTCTNRYTITRTYRATDVCGNFAECTQIITVNDQTAPVITCPANITVTSPAGSCNAVVNFTVTATDNCNGPVTIVSNPASGFAFPVGITTVTSTATDACGNSSTCTFTVTVLDGQLPVITAQPVNRTVCSGGSATFNVTAITSPNAGGPIAYQWQQWNGGAWVNIAGATASSYTVSNATVSMNTNTFRVVLTGLCSIVNSNAATLFVNPLPSISLSATPPPSLLPNQTTTLTATTNPSGGTYAWFFNGTAIPGVTGPVLGPIGVDGIGSYRVVYTDPLGCVNNSATINVTGQPSNQLWVYPNPNQGQFQVRYYNQVNEKLTLNIYNALGQKIYQKDFNTTTTYTRIDVNLGTNFSEGVYTVEVVNGAGMKVGSRRVLVRHP